MEIISFNGKTYNSLEEMPADQRAAYEQVMSFMKDENNNGIPDMFEGDVIQKDDRNGEHAHHRQRAGDAEC